MKKRRFLAWLIICSASLVLSACAPSRTSWKGQYDRLVVYLKEISEARRKNTQVKETDIEEADGQEDEKDDPGTVVQNDQKGGDVEAARERLLSGTDIENVAPKEETVPEKGGIILYDAVIEQYKEALRNDLYIDIFNGRSKGMEAIGDLVNPFLLSHARSYVGYSRYGGGHSDKEYRIYYALSDENGDGIDELFISAGADEASATLYDVFTYYDQKPVSLFGSDVLGERTRLTVHDDGIFAVDSSSAYDISSTSYYQLPADTCTPVLLREFGLYEEEYYDIDENGIRKVITADEFVALAREGDQKGKRSFEWVQIEVEGVTDMAKLDVVFTHLEGLNEIDGQMEEYARIEGVDKDGHIHWTYTTERYFCTELTRVEEIGGYHGLYYFNESGTLTALDPQSGQIVWKNGDFGGASIAVAFHEDGDLFVAGYYGPDFYWVDPEGHTICRIKELDPRYFWPERIRCDDGQITVTMMGSLEGGYEEHTISFELESVRGLVRE